METSDELVLKMRKPYTITKQREKWTEEEHNKFIEALKLYGRAWQRIEDHIGTKTAVQIRSHAQKFFTKLEKEAATKGVPFGQAHDIEIPPPRPKRKPSSPYPRKTGLGSLSPSVEASEDKTPKSPSPLSKQTINVENHGAWKIQGTKDINSEDASCSEVLNLFQDAPAASISYLNKGSSSLFIPLKKETKDKTALKGSGLSMGLDKDSKQNPVHDAQEEGANISKHVPIDFMKNSSDANLSASNAKPSLNPAIPATSEMNTDNSGISSVHQLFPGFPPFAQFHNISSAFSSLIMSSLLQNPAVHAAATVAASFWPSGGIDASTASSSESVHGGIPLRHINPSPNMAAIAAATVAAASAWWATQGLLPMYPPLHTGFAFAPPPTTSIPVEDTTRAPESRKEERSDALKDSIAIGEQDGDLEQSEALRDSSSSDSAEHMGSKANKFKPLSNNGVADADNVRNNKKKLDRSSCGSNTPSSSEEVETDAVLKKQDGENKDEPNQDHLNNPPSVEANIRRIRGSIGIMNESWKEVSEEGRVAFRALFARQVLPQSFSPPHLKEATGELPVDLNMKASSEPTDLYYIHGFDGPSSEGSLTSEISHGKLKARKSIGFKPYKRCSVEAKDSRATAGDGNGNKRIRLEGETSI